MGKQQKKTAKGRIDKYYRLAKEQGYRSRAAFKLLQLNKKYDFLSKAKVVIDLCAAPGGWLQVASKTCKPGAIIVGVDLVPIKRIQGADTFVTDISTDTCRSLIKNYLKTWKADVVLHDGAPNVGTSWLQDAYSQAELVLQSLKLATEFLVSDGVFVTKVFRSKDFNSLLWVFNQLFRNVHVTKPESSRSVSAEIFVVCLGYKASKFDAKILNTKYVFEDATQKKVDVEQKIYHPEIEKRQREGYEDGNYTLFKSITASDFVQSNQPLQVLSTYNVIRFEGESDQILKSRKYTDREILSCCEDLRVLGRREFKALLKWRLKCRKEMGIDIKKDKSETIEGSIVSVKENDDAIDAELTEATEQDAKARKKERKKSYEKKLKALKRMSSKVDSISTLDDDLQSAVFNTKYDIDDKMPEDDSTESDLEPIENNANVSDTMRLEAELDHMYEEYKNRKELRYQRIKEKRKSKEREFTGFGSDTSMSNSNDERGPTVFDKLSKNVREFYDDKLFEGLNKAIDIKPKSCSISLPNNKKKKEIYLKSEPESESSSEENEEQPYNLEDFNDEAIDLAIQLKNGKLKKSGLEDEAYNRWSFLRTENLPEWFLDDENPHRIPQKPISKEAAQAIKAKAKILEERPIKKVLEAKLRTKQHAAKKIARVQKKAEHISESIELTEREKAKQIQRIMSRALKGKQKKKPTLVVAKGARRGISGRPKGVKGRYKMVDKRMKKELRAEKRQSKKRK